MVDRPIEYKDKENNNNNTKNKKSKKLWPPRRDRQREREPPRTAFQVTDGYLDLALLVCTVTETEVLGPQQLGEGEASLVVSEGEAANASSLW
ncbi:hypothetical protein L249_3287, partial [Ophiocordyceps polyrhachis-furcata BCC 54312]